MALFKGFLKVLTYYLVGLGLAGLSYSIVGHPYIHGPGFHHIIILLTFLGGFLWLVVGAIQLGLYSVHGIHYS
jgi:hypothetical protein